MKAYLRYNYLILQIDEPTQSDPMPSAANPSANSEHSDPILQAYQELQSQGLSSGPPAYTTHTQYKPTPTSHSVINVEEASTYRGATDQMYGKLQIYKSLDLIEAYRGGFKQPQGLQYSDKQ